MGLPIATILLLILACLFCAAGCTSPPIGLNNGALLPCPDKPNCVNTRSTDPRHKIDPIPYTGKLVDAHDQMLDVVESMPRTKIIKADDAYIHAVFRSLIFRFADDVEFLFDDQAKVIHFRSASRLGYSDLGANRKRMEEIRARFTRPD